MFTVSTHKTFRQVYIWKMFYFIKLSSASVTPPNWKLMETVFVGNLRSKVEYSIFHILNYPSYGYGSFRE